MTGGQLGYANGENSAYAKYRRAESAFMDAAERDNNLARKVQELTRKVRVSPKDQEAYQNLLREANVEVAKRADATMRFADRAEKIIKKTKLNKTLKGAGIGLAAGSAVGLGLAARANKNIKKSNEYLNNRKKKK